MASPHDNLSLKLINPYTKAEASVLSPIKSAVSARLVTNITAPPKPEKYDYS